MLLNYRLLSSKNIHKLSNKKISFFQFNLRYFSSPSDSSSSSHNLMNPELYTENAFQSIIRLPQYADKYKTQYIEATHILKSILEEGPTGIAQRAITKVGVNPIKLTE